MGLCETTKECLSKLDGHLPLRHSPLPGSNSRQRAQTYLLLIKIHEQKITSTFQLLLLLSASSFQLISFSLKWAAAKKTPTSSCVSTSHHLLHHNLSSPNPLHQSPNPPPPLPPVHRNPTRPNSFRSPTITAPDPSKTSPLSSSLFSSLSQLLGSVYSQYVIKIRTITTPLLLFTIPLQVPVLKTHFLTILTIGCLWVLVFLRQNLIF